MVSWRKRVWNYASKLMKQKRIYCYFDRIHICGAHVQDIVSVYELEAHFTYQVQTDTQISTRRLIGSWKYQYIQNIGMLIHPKRKDQAYKALYLKLITDPKIGWKKYKK